MRAIVSSAPATAVPELFDRLRSGPGDSQRTLKVKKWPLLSARERLRHGDKLMLKQLMERNTGHRYGLKLGLVESINSKSAILRARARGYRDPEYFKLKIFQRCSLPDNPWAKVVL